MTDQVEDEDDDDDGYHGPRNIILHLIHIMIL